MQLALLEAAGGAVRHDRSRIGFARRSSGYRTLTIKTRTTFIAAAMSALLLSACSAASPLAAAPPARALAAPWPSGVTATAAAHRLLARDTRPTSHRPPTTMSQLRKCPATGLSSDIRGTRLRVLRYGDRPTVLQMWGGPTAPLVVVFHGMNSCIEMIQSQTDLAKLAPAYGVNILWLSGKPTPGRSWNVDNDCCSPATTHHTDDYPYIAAALDTAYAAGSLRPSAVVSTGMSNGGGMSISAACHFPKRFTIIVAAAGWVPDHCPRMNMTLITIGGTADSSLGAEKAAQNADKWRTSVMKGCPAAPALARHVALTVTTWTCANRHYVKVVQLNNVPHVWPTYGFYDADDEVLDVATDDN
jgi:poly(3-hydroxybutyrate) depolymerase